jgi:nucleoid-associated protein YgaU
MAPLKNMSPVPPTIESRAEDLVLRKAHRSGGPTKLEEVSDSALVRWRAPTDQLPEREPYRPKPLDSVAAAIDAGAPPAQPQAEHPNVPLAADRQPVPGTLYKIVYGDQLRTLADRLYGHADREDAILAANPLITDPDRIFVGQIIYLPVVPPTVMAPSAGQFSSVAGTSTASAPPKL